MRIRNEQREVETSGLKSTNAFQISASSHMFRVLSDGMYSDKVTAVIRELTCNARDAHTAAGKEHVPYKVHLPTILEPEFYVRDYGIGLCYDDVMTLYTTYGKSLKNDSNDMIGGLGLGSKAPFAYTDQFTIEGRFDGELNLYSCFVDTNGEPQIAHLTCKDTDEGNGLTIRMPVASKDFGEFQDKATKLFEYYDPIPDINTPLTFPDKETSFEDVGKWRVWTKPNDSRYSYGYSPYKGVAYAIQGQVRYPISPDKLVGVDENLRSMLSGTNLDIWFDIGELEVAANREDLSYSEFTIKNIGLRLQIVYDNLLVKATESIEDATSLWDASIKAEDIKTIFKNNSSLSKSIIAGMSYKGKPLFSSEVDMCKVTLSSVWSGEMRRVPKTSSQNKNLMFRDMDSYARWHVGTMKEKRIYYVDKPTQRIPSTIKFNLGEDKHSLYLCSGTAKEFKKLLDYLGNPPYTKTSTLTQPPTQARSGGGKVMLKRYDEDRYNTWTDEEHEILDGGVYIKLFAGEIDLRYHHNADLISRVAYLRHTLGDTTEIIGVPGTFHSRLDKNIDKWVSFEDHYEKMVDKERKKLSNHKECIRFITLHSLYRVSDYYIKRILELSGDLKSPYTSKVLRELVKGKKEYDILLLKYNKKLSTIEKLFSSKRDQAYLDRMERELKEVKDKHPLITSYLDQYGVDTKLVLDDVKKLLT